MMMNWSTTYKAHSAQRTLRSEKRSRGSIRCIYLEECQSHLFSSIAVYVGIGGNGAKTRAREKKYRNS